MIRDLILFVKGEYSSSICYPKGSNIFSAFNNCPISELKAVIIGQDPYHGPNQANGLCFSVNKGIVHPPSLINIFKEIDLDKNAPKDWPAEPFKLISIKSLPKLFLNFWKT